MNKGVSTVLWRWLCLAVGVALAERIVPGIECTSGSTLLVVVVLLSVFNAFLKPVLVLFTLPLVILSAGFALWLINALLLLGVSRLVDGFTVSSLGTALLGSLIISATNLAFAMANKVKVPPARRGPPPPSRPNPPPGKGDIIDI